MKHIILYLFLITTAISCYDAEEFWLDENIKEGGTYYPVIQTLTITPGSGDFFESGKEINIALQYWSRDEVKEIKYYQTVDGVETLIDTKPYTPSFDPVSEAELFNYTTTLPSVDSGSSVGYRVSVTTVFDLSRESSKTVTVN